MKLEAVYVKPIPIVLLFLRVCAEDVESFPFSIFMTLPTM